MRHIKQKSKEINRNASKELTIYQQHFNDYRREVKEKGILPGDIYNMDKIGFRISIGGSQ